MTRRESATSASRTGFNDQDGEGGTLATGRLQYDPRGFRYCTSEKVALVDADTRIHEGVVQQASRDSHYDIYQRSFLLRRLDRAVEQVVLSASDSPASAVHAAVRAWVDRQDNRQEHRDLDLAEGTEQYLKDNVTNGCVFDHFQDDAY
jgi:hypothetical protein